MTLPLLPSAGSQQPRLLSQLLTDARETTPLPLGADAGFARWLAQNHVTDLDDPDAHYDYRGAYLADQQRTGNGHFPDTFKQHGHPTFSVESQYSAGDDDGGHWQGEQFTPGPTHDTSQPMASPPADPNGGDLSPLRDLLKQGARGLAESGYDTASGLADVLGATKVADALHRSRDEMRAFYGDPRSGWGQAGAVGGTLLGQGALSAVPGALASRAAAALPQAGLAARALARVLNPLGAEGGASGAVSRAMGGAALDLPLAAARAADPRTSTLGAVADATGNRTLQRAAGSFPARLLGEAATDVGGGVALEAASHALPAAAQDLGRVLGDRRGAVGDLSQHPIDRALAAATSSADHPVDRAINQALDGLPVVYDPSTEAASVPHHSTRQPRNEAGQFNGAPMRLYHGSSHNFDQFDIGQIGRGEGAQVYGHGLYFAEHPVVADRYREDAVAFPDVTIGEKTYRRQDMFFGQHTHKSFPIPSEDYLAQRLSSETREAMRAHTQLGTDTPPTQEGIVQGIRQRHQETLAEIAANPRDWSPKARGNVEATGRLLDDAERRGITIHMPQPQVYAADAAVTPDQLLHWDTPLHQQPEPVKAALRQMGVSVEPPPQQYQIHYTEAGTGHQRTMYTEVPKLTRENMIPALEMRGHTVTGVEPMEQGGETGSSLYKRLSDMAVAPGQSFVVHGQVGGNAAAASEQLRAAGIPGLRYSDMGSRSISGDDATHNVVLFSHEPVKVVGKAGRLAALKADLQARGLTAFSALPAATGGALLLKHGLTRDDVEGM